MASYGQVGYASDDVGWLIIVTRWLFTHAGHHVMVIVSVASGTLR